MKGIMIVFVICSLMVLVTVPAFAETNVTRLKWEPIKWDDKNWDEEDTTIQTAVAIFITADWLQTRYISSNPDKFYETNPMLGSHPSLGDVDRYFATCLIGNTLIAYVLPRDLRKFWQTISLTMEMQYVNHNYNMGVKMKF